MSEAVMKKIARPIGFSVAHDMCKAEDVSISQVESYELLELYEGNRRFANMIFSKLARNPNITLETMARLIERGFSNEIVMNPAIRLLIVEDINKAYLFLGDHVMSILGYKGRHE